MNLNITHFWAGMHTNLTKLINTIPKENFIQWEVIQRNMFLKDHRYVDPELDYLQSLPNWELRWKPMLKESNFGAPTMYSSYPKSSGNLIHMAYHIAKLEEKTNCKVEDMDTIFEFGGGYGRLCKLIHDLGFKGNYTIYDLTKFSELQKYYLEHFNIKINYMTSVEDLKDIKAYKDSLLIATWSLSEVPIRLRNLVLRQVDTFNYYLITYQILNPPHDNRDYVHNIKYFKEWRELKPEFEWSDWEIPHLKENYYTIGQRNNAK